MPWSAHPCRRLLPSKAPDMPEVREVRNRVLYDHYRRLWIGMHEFLLTNECVIQMMEGADGRQRRAATIPLAQA
jgi:hypothetical protein